MFNDKELSAVVGEVLPIVAEAAAVIEEVRGRGFEQLEKDDRSPVTEADHAADALLRERLLVLLPCGWLSEETADNEKRFEEDMLWVVDPLDGTKEFIKGLPEYSVAVGLVERGKPILGVVQNPRTGEAFHAWRAGGAWRGTERLRVVEGDRLLASRSEIKRGEFEPFDAGWDVVAMGSIEYKLALIGAGVASVTFSRGPKHEWDVCAGAMIVEEAGGKVTDLFGDDLVFNQPFPKTKGILAGAPEAYERALARLQDVGASDRMNEFG